MRGCVLPQKVFKNWSFAIKVPIFNTRSRGTGAGAPSALLDSCLERMLPPPEGHNILYSAWQFLYRSGQVWGHTSEQVWEHTPRSPCNCIHSASVCTLPRQTPGPPCPYPSDRTPPDATMKLVDAHSFRCSASQKRTHLSRSVWAARHTNKM